MCRGEDVDETQFFCRCFLRRTLRRRSREKEELLSLIYEEVEEDIRVKLDIEVQIVATLPDKEYGDNEFSYREVYFMNDFEYIDEDNIDDIE